MAKIADLNKGDRVRWGTSQGRTTGTVVAVKTKPFSIKGTDLTASKDDPKVVVESEKTGARAGHKPSALSKLAARATGKGATAKAGGTKAKDAKAKDTNAKDTKAKDEKRKADKKPKAETKPTSSDKARSKSKAKATAEKKKAKSGR